MSPIAPVAPSPLDLGRLSLDPPISIDAGLDVVFVRSFENGTTSATSFLPEVPDGLVIEEKGGGSVPVLIARNLTDRPILVLAGQLIRGGKQNRGVNADAIVPAGGSIEIPVTCVEQGRWSGGGIGKFSREGIEPTFIRSAKMRSIHRLRREVGQESDRSGVSREHHADQREVWEQIAAFREHCEIGDHSTDLLDALRRSGERDAGVLDLEKAREAGSSACGALIFVGGEFVGGDILATSHWFAQVRDDLLRSTVSSHRYARAMRRDQFEPSGSESIAIAASAILDGLRQGAWRKHRSLGVEQAWQIDHPFLESSATLAPEGETLHVLIGTRHRPSVFSGNRAVDWNL